LEGAKTKMKIFIYVGIIIVVGILGLMVGLKYGTLNADSGNTQKFILNEDMIILDDSSDKIGELPKGTILYSIPDPWAEDSMLFKVYFRVYENDCSPINELAPMPNLKKYQIIEFFLKTKEWGKKRK